MKVFEEISIADTVQLTSRKVTPEGFLNAPAHLARTGVQMYQASEFPALVAAGMDATQKLRLYRSPEEVFDPVSMASFDGISVIMEPHQTVTADNWKRLAVGDVHQISRDGDLLGAARLMVRDRTAVGDIQAGKKHLSNGYKFTLDLTPGTTPDGQVYDGLQRSIRGNHVAICDNPRGGDSCTIADTIPKGERRMITISIDGIPVEVGDTAAAAITKVIHQRDAALAAPAQLTYKLGDQTKTITGDALTAELAARDAEVKDLKSKITTPEQFEAEVGKRVAVRVALVGDALRLVPDYKADGKDNETVQREVITAVVAHDTTAKAVTTALLGAIELTAADGALLSTTFKAVAAAAARPDAVQTTTGDAATARALAGDVKTVAHTKATGREAFLAKQKTAWQPAAAR